jgi:hypothetical protein
MASGSGQIGLRNGPANPPQGHHHRQPDMLSEILRLIESALSTADWVEGDGNGEVRVDQERLAARPHERAQRLGERSPALVVERMND